MEFLTFLMLAVAMLSLLKFVTYDCGISLSKLFKKQESNIDDITKLIHKPTTTSKPEKTPDNVDTPYLYLNIYEGEKEIGDIMIYLYESDLPITTKNFKELCSSKNPKFGYKNCTFHRIIKDFMLQGGDFTNHNGTGGQSIYQHKFEDENFKYKNKKGTISMANSGPDTNGSQFFINTSDNHNLDNKHVVFGEVVEGMEVVEYLNTIKTGSKDLPETQIRINDCGRVWLEEEEKDDIVDTETTTDDKQKYTDYLKDT